MSVQAHEHRPHVVLDLPSRDWKALKIERLLDLTGRPQPLRLLEIGTGSGGIARYFGTHAALHCDVTAVDVVDSRLVRHGYDYRSVEGAELPFAPKSLDVDVTNHVVEHVGDAAAQQRHLAEVHWVMKPDGIGCLAVPDRWILTEPHYRPRFLRWLPRPRRMPYLRLMRKGAFYDCEPLKMRRLEGKLAAAEFRYRNSCVEAWHATIEIVRHRSFGARTLRAVPDALAPLRRIIPGLVHRVEREAA